MNRTRILLLSAFMITMLLPLISDTSSQSSEVITLNDSSVLITSNIDEATPWWNTTYHYRQHVNLTDTNSTPRVDVPMHMWFSFDNNTSYVDSIRVVDGNGDEVPSQVYNYSYWEDTDYVKGATVFWYASIDADSTSTYWLYFSELKTIEATDYTSVVWFARTTGTLTGKFGPNYWSFRGDWYNVTMLSASGGKITNAAHKMDDGSWNWNWGTDRGSMHWNPDGLGGQTTNNLNPIAGTTFVKEEGPLFVNYTTQFPFGSYATLNVTYTFYKWGWIFSTWIEYTATTSGSGRTDEWVFYPYITTQGIEVAEDLSQTYYANWAASSNKGKPAGFGWWNPNGMSQGTIRISHDSWNTNPSYTNNYDNYYYRWWDASSYEFWDTVIPTIYAQAGTVLEETNAFAVWNGSIGQDGYMNVFNATSRYLPIIQARGEVSSYSFRINVQDLGGSNIEGVNVTLLNPTTGEILYKSSGGPYTSLTDSNGNVTFIGLLNQSYRIDAWIDSAVWLQEEAGSTGMNVTWSGEQIATGPFTSVGITLDLASIDIHLADLRGSALATSGSQSVQVRVYNATDSDPGNWKYMDYEFTDSSGYLTFFRLPKSDWIFNFSYSNTDTGHIYQEADFAEYVSYSIPATDIINDLSRPNWQLPLVTLEFNVKAYDGANVKDAFVRISKRGTGDPIAIGVTDYYNITHYTDANGNVTFYRVLNGTWNIYLYRIDDYGQTAFNDTESLVDVQGYVQKDMVIPLTWLRVLVEDGSGNRVPSAQIDLKVNGQPVVTAFTDTSGWYNFTWIMANDSSIPWDYTIYVSKLGNPDTKTVYASFDYLYYNTIYLSPMSYNAMYTELNATTSTYSWKYGDNQTFVIGWYNRTGTNDANAADTALTNYASGWLNFSIYHQGLLVDIGWWNGTSPWYVAHEVSDGIYFTIIIDTIYFKMNASSYPYIIKINGSAPGYTDTEIYIITVVVTVADTSTNGILSDSFIWSEGFTTPYSLETAPTGRDAFNITNLDYYNYTIYDSQDQVIGAGSLLDQGGGVYLFSDTTLNGSDIGDYEIEIWLYRQNYVNQTLWLTVTIQPITTILTWLAQPTVYTWGSGFESATLQFWDSVNSIVIPTADSIILYWINVDTGETVLIDSSGTLVYTYSRSIVANGTWEIHAYVSKANYVSQDNIVSTTFLVSPEVTTIILTSSNTETIEWGSEYAEFDFDYNSSGPISGAGLFEISWTGEVELIDNGDGSYRLRLLTVQEAANYTVTFSLWIENRTKASESVTVNVLIPLEVTAAAGFSEQDPIQQYWTRNFSLVINAGDLSNLSAYVSGVTVSYSFPAGGISGILSENLTGRYYYLEFPAMNAPGPGVYEIDIDASRVGCSSTSTSIFIEVVATPTLASAEIQLLTVYYADILKLNFTWTSVLDGIEGITSPDSVTVQLWTGIEQIVSDVGGVQDLGLGFYSFEMNSKSLGMTADSAITPTSYFFVITMNKLGYQSPFAVTIIILVLQTPTEMTKDSIDSIIWSEDITLIVHLRDIIHSEYIWENATVTFIFESFAVNFTSLNNGTFVLTFNSQDAFNSSTEAHLATVVYSIPNYIDGTLDMPIIVNPVPASIILDPLDSSYDWASTFDLSIAITLDSNPLLRVNVSIVYFYWAGYPYVNGTLVYNPTWSEYQGTVNASLIPAGARTLNIVAERLNYTIPVVSIQLDILELDTDLSANVGSIHAISGVDESSEVRLTYTSGLTVLEGATVTFLWDGLERTASWADGEYVFQFNPSGDSGLSVPGVYLLNFTAQLMNYTIQTETITLHLAARTQIIAETYRVEEGLDFVLVFAYWDMVNDRAVGGTAILQYVIGSAAPITADATQFNGTHYRLALTSADFGEISPDAYHIKVYASAPGYQNWTASEFAEIEVFIVSPTVDILGFRIERNTLFLIMGMTGLFALVAGSVVGVQRWRIPHAIKQINKAIKQMENGKVASVEGIKSMGVIISELLAPGLAELDIEAPLIDAISEGAVPGLDETVDILGELDTLDDLGVEEPVITDEVSDFESELEAELDEIIETDSEVVDGPEPIPDVEEPEVELESDSEPAMAPETEKVDVEPEEVEVSEDVVDETSLEEDQIEVLEEEPEVEEPEPESDVDEEITEVEVPEFDEEPKSKIEEPEPMESEDSSVDAEADDEIELDEDDTSPDLIEDVDEGIETQDEAISDEETSDSDYSSDDTIVEPEGKPLDSTDDMEDESPEESPFEDLELDSELDEDE